MHSGINATIISYDNLGGAIQFLIDFEKAGRKSRLSHKIKSRLYLPDA